jgi:hypothetical protein
LIASPSVIKSLYIKGELNLAKRFHPKRIYPVWIDGIDWSDCVPIDFINTQYIDMRKEKYEAGLNTLVNVLKRAQASSGQDAAIDRQDIVSHHQHASLPVSTVHTTSSGRKFSRALLLNGVLVAVVLFAIIGAVIYKSYAQQTTSNQPTPLATATVCIPHLNQSYMGTTRGFANGFITFSLVSQDQQGNVSLGVIFTRADNNKQANYACQGKVHHQ